MKALKSYPGMSTEFCPRFLTIIFSMMSYLIGPTTPTRIPSQSGNIWSKRRCVIFRFHSFTFSPALVIRRGLGHIKSHVHSEDKISLWRRIKPEYRLCAGPTWVLSDGRMEHEGPSPAWVFPARRARWECYLFLLFSPNVNLLTCSLGENS